MGELTEFLTMQSNVLVGILELNCGKTYGRRRNANGKEGKLFYGVKHDYEHLPPFKTPYEIKHNGKNMNAQHQSADCSRYVKDKYVVFKLNQFTTQERTEVTLVETIGDVDDVNAFSTYRTYVSGFKLQSSWHKELAQFRKKNDIIELSNKTLFMHNQTQPQSQSQSQLPICEIFTIDPEGCKDMDDGVGISTSNINRDGDTIYDIAIAITHVPSYLIASDLTSTQLISSLSNTCSIYLPERVINMIPKLFAEQLCSLTKDTVKPALVLHLIWNATKNTMVKQYIQIENVSITHNFAYETPELYQFGKYDTLFTSIRNMNLHYKSFDVCQTIGDSHDVVAYLMTYMNNYTVEWLHENSVPCIYRINQKRNIEELPTELRHLKQKIGNYAGEYCDEVGLKKYGGDTTIWTHITSPMRRLADLTNMITIAYCLHPQIYEPLVEFRDYCLTIVPRISEEYKKSKRVSMDCELFGYVCQTTTLQLNEKTFDGIVIDINNTQSQCDMNIGNCQTFIEYVVYIPELSRIFIAKTSKLLTLYEKITCKIVVFDEGHSIKDKVKLAIL